MSKDDEVRGKERVMAIVPKTGGKVLKCGVCGYMYIPIMKHGRLPNGYRRCPHGCVWPDMKRGSWTDEKVK